VRPALASTATHPPLPVVTPLTQFFWDGGRERRLMILRCTRCGHHVHLPRPICNRCRSTDLAPAEMAGTGSLYAYTVTVQAFHPFYIDKLPYVAAVVELDEEPGLRLTTQIIDCPEADLRTGMRVEIAWTAVAPDLTLPYFRPAR
jgi:uncharacterized OB-fold protein